MVLEILRWTVSSSHVAMADATQEPYDKCITELNKITLKKIKKIEDNSTEEPPAVSPDIPR